ncbi:hypothetical protein [Methylobacterium iners]|uniref:hypothetical protein n=1 Tax=Methylobacterium iners TaxID=418707 RepID=UPI001EE1F179|nr:hypothetical protein [Methylobacterium iners]
MADHPTSAPKVPAEPGASPAGAASIPAPPPRRDGFVALSVAALTLGTVLLGALLPGSPVQPAASPASDVTCAEWTDGCRVCQRLAEGPGCSMPGIACVPAESRCLRRVGG